MSSTPEPRLDPKPSVGVDDIVAPQIAATSEGQSAALNAFEAESLSNAALRQRIKGRGDWGTRIFWIMVSWLAAVVIAVGLQGFGGWKFHLSDSVIIAFITTTTVNVIGLGYIVAKYFFASKD
jgi:hypothetical protein